VGRADLADLVVEVTGRHSSKSEFWIAFDDQFGFILRLSAGGKLAEGRLHGVVVRWPEDEEQDIVVVNELHGYRDDEPYWLLQIQGGLGGPRQPDRRDPRRLRSDEREPVLREMSDRAPSTGVT